MPQVLTMTQQPGESTEDFATRIAQQADSFFRTGEAAPVDESGEPTAESTDVSADEEPAPSA